MRFDRQRFLLKEEGMKALESAHIVVYGLGGSGSPIALQLAYSGIMNLTIVDPDVVSEQDLNRQVLYAEGDIGQLKVVAAKNRLLSICSTLKITSGQRHEQEEVLESISGATAVVDAVDEYRFKVTLDRYCRAEGVPMIHTSAVGLRGSVVTFASGEESYESFFGLPSLGRALETVTDAEFEKRRLALIPRLVGKYYPTDVINALVEGSIHWQTLVPAPIVAGGIAVSEVMRICLGQQPLYQAPRMLTFDLASGWFTIQERKEWWRH